MYTLNLTVNIFIKITLECINYTKTLTDIFLLTYLKMYTQKLSTKLYL